MTAAQVLEAAEKSAVSAVLSNPPAIGRVLAIVHASAFMDEGRRRIVAAMERCHAAGTPIDPVTLEAELVRANDLTPTSNRDTLAELYDFAPDAENVEHYAKILADAEQRRTLASVFTRALLLAEGTGTAASAIAAEVRSKLEVLAHSSANNPKWYLLSDLLDDPTLTAPPFCSLPPIGYRGRVTLLVGREKKGGKSTTACIAVSLASRQGMKVLYITLDEPLADTVGRLHRFGADPANVYLMTTRPDDLGALVKELAVDVVVIDALSHYVAKDAPESGDSAGWTRVMMPLVAVARTYQVALILIQHAGKASGQYRDSTAIGANVDVIITLEQRPDGSRKAKTEGRFAVPGFTVTIDADGRPAFDVDLGDSTPDRETAPEVVQRQVLRLLQSAEPDRLKTAEWQRLANEQKVSRTAFYRARKALLVDGRASHQSTLYSVSPSGTRWLEKAVV